MPLPPNVRPQRQGPQPSTFRFIQNRKRGRVRWRAVLGHGPRALPAITVRVVPFVSAALVTVRFVPSIPRRILLSERFLRQRRVRAPVDGPSALPVAAPSPARPAGP